jgi:glutamate-1-semialdehyde 2,1-aminomutase
MMALRTARAFTGRSHVLRFAGSYHGNYDAVLADDARGLTPGPASELVTVPVGDGEACAAAIERHGERLAAVIVDLMPNRAGLTPLDPDLVRRLRELTAARGILLLVDEVITLRLQVGGMQARYGLTPDLVTMGKVIGGGLPVGAWGGRADVMAILDPREPGALAHAGTFSANPLTAAAGAVALDLLDANAVARVNAHGEDLRGRVSALGYRVAGSGSLFRLLDLAGAEDWWRLYRAGVLVGGNGLCALSTVMDADTVDELERRFAAARLPG